MTPKYVLAAPAVVIQYGEKCLIDSSLAKYKSKTLNMEPIPRYYEAGSVEWEDG